MSEDDPRLRSLRAELRAVAEVVRLERQLADLKSQAALDIATLGFELLELAEAGSKRALLVAEILRRWGCQ